MNPRLKSILSELRARFEALYGDRLVRLILYGSQARGDADPDSDIDVLVVIRGEVVPGREIERTGDVVSEISLAYQTVVSCVFVSEERYDSEWTPLLSNARREGVLV
jgi:predicted nucleotidyltransferase